MPNYRSLYMAAHLVAQKEETIYIRQIPEKRRNANEMNLFVWKADTAVLCSKHFEQNAFQRNIT